MKIKLCSALVSLSLILGTATEVFAAGYTITYHGTGDNRVIEQTDEYAYDGDYSMYISYVGREKVAENYAELKMPASSMTDGRYTLSFYNWGRASAFTEISISDSITFGYSDMTSSATEKEGWTKYSVSFDYTAQTENFVAFRFFGGTSKAAIDNVSLTSENGTENVLTDGGFEEYTEPAETPWDTTKYRPKNFMSIPKSGGVALSWVNPEADTLTGIKVYDITDGGETLITDEISTASSALVNYEFSGAGENIYQFKVVFTFSDKGDFSYFLADAPLASGATNTFEIGNWTIYQASHGKAGYVPAEIKLDYDTKYGDSGASLKVESNVDRSRSDMNGNTYVQASIALPLNVGSTYDISFMQKSVKAKDGIQVNFGGTKFDDATLVLPFTGTTEGWVARNYKYTCAGNTTMRILMEYQCEAMWFDNFEIYEYKDGARVGENLFVDGTFDSIDTEAAGELTNVSATSTKDSVTLSYTAPAKNCSDINIYEWKFDKYEYRGKLSTSAGKVTITGLEKDKEYKYKLVPLNNAQIEGAGEEITVKTLLPEYEVYEPALYKNSETLSVLNGAGKYTAELRVKNNTVTSGVNAELIAAVYNGGVLENVYSKAALVAKTSKKKDPEKLTVEFNLPEGDGYSVRLFAIDSRAGLDILYPHKTYN